MPASSGSLTQGGLGHISIAEGKEGVPKAGRAELPPPCPKGGSPHQGSSSQQLIWKAGAEGCAEYTPDFTKCRTAEQVPGAEDHSVSLIKGWEVGAGSWSAGQGARSLCMPQDCPGGPQEHHLAACKAINKGFIKPRLGFSTTFPTKD